MSHYLIFIFQNDIPRGFRNSPRVTSVLQQQIQALEQIRDSQRHLYLQESGGVKNDRPKENRLFKGIGTGSVAGNNYRIVDSDQFSTEDVRNDFKTKVKTF